MKRFGTFLMILGLGAGIALGISTIVNVSVDGVPLLAAIGLGKLSFLVALGLMGVGAGVRRLALREERRQLQSPEGDQHRNRIS